MSQPPKLLSQLKPVSQLAQNFGVKMLGYGPPGTGKTPISATAPRPVICAVEPGLLSMRNVNDVPAFPAFDSKSITQFFDWVFRSPETSNFDTIVIDSVSQMAEVILVEEEKNNKHGLKAYGEMARRVYEWLEGLYYLKDKHIYLIAKQTIEETDGAKTARPEFPGQQLKIKVPHLYDEIIHIDIANIPGMQPQVAFRTKAGFGVVARDRSGMLNEFEPPHLGQMFAKCTSNPQTTQGA